MIKIKRDLLYKKEIYELGTGKPISFLKVFLSDGTSANIIYRCMRWSATHKMTFLAYFFQVLNKIINQCVIGIYADFGTGFVLLHPTGVVINSSVKGIRNIAVESGVVIGEEKGGYPQLGSDIFIGSGAKIIGALSIGNNVKIGANAVIIKNVPDNATAVGIPGRIIKTTVK